MSPHFKKMPGYLPTILSGFDGERHEKFLCIICKLLLKDPQQTRCGHRFCKNCIEEKLSCHNTKYKCQKCEIEEPSEDNTLTAKQVFPDRAMLREMKELKTKCINADCDWRGTFQNYEIHEPKCEYRLIECARVGCFEKIRPRDMTRHLDEECNMRIVRCGYCEEGVIFKTIQTHENECPMCPVPCMNCGQKVLRGKLEEHVDVNTGDCPKKMQPCDYANLGCIVLIECGTQAEHNSIAFEDHMSLLLKETLNVNRLREGAEENAIHLRQLTATASDHGQSIENLSEHVERVQNNLQQIPSPAAATAAVPSESTHGRFRALQEQLVGMNTKSDGLDRRVTTYHDILAVLNSEVEQNGEIVQKIRNEDKHFRERLEGTERKTKAQDRIIALKDVTLAEQDLRIQSLELASYKGILTWRIPNFARKRRDAISGRTLSLYSPSFFTSRHGYRMCARIYLNGDGMGKGSHVSLFFVIMKGEYDAILKWPFSQKVTLMWLDQNNREHLIDAFRPDPQSSSFKRPIGDMNVASGCPLFMSLSLLESGRHAYVKDDTAFLRIIVDTSDI